MYHIPSLKSISLYDKEVSPFLLKGISHIKKPYLLSYQSVLLESWRGIIFNLQSVLFAIIKLYSYSYQRVFFSQGRCIAFSHWSVSLSRKRRIIFLIGRVSYCLQRSTIFFIEEYPLHYQAVKSCLSKCISCTIKGYHTSYKRVSL